MTLYDAFYWIKELSNNVDGKIEARYINFEMEKLFHLPEKQESNTFNTGVSVCKPKFTVDKKVTPKNPKR